MRDIGTGRATTAPEFVHLMSDLAGRRPWIDLQRFRAGEVCHGMAAVGRALADLDCAPSGDLRTGFCEMWGEL